MPVLGWLRSRLHSVADHDQGMVGCTYVCSNDLNAGLVTIFRIACFCDKSPSKSTIAVESPLFTLDVCKYTHLYPGAEAEVLR